MRRFEFVAGTSAKFWTAGVEGSTFIVIYGRLGTAGQRKDKAFPTEEAARRELEKKIAEKLREGYAEVGAAAAAPVAPAAAPAVPEPLKKPVLPPRVQVRQPRADQLDAATQAVRQLEAALGRRSYQVGRAARRARRALEAIAGYNPAGNAALCGAFDKLMERVVAGPPRLSLRLAIELLGELDVKAFARAVALWRKAPAMTPGMLPVAVIVQQVEHLGDPEIALRVGQLLADRPGHGGGSETGWQRRWHSLAPHLEGHLRYTGSTLAAYLHDLGKAAHGGDVHIARRAARMSEPRKASEPGKPDKASKPAA